MPVAKGGFRHDLSRVGRLLVRHKGRRVQDVRPPADRERLVRGPDLAAVGLGHEHVFGRALGCLGRVPIAAHVDEVAVRSRLLVEIERRIAAVDRRRLHRVRQFHRRRQEHGQARGRVVHGHERPHEAAFRALEVEVIVGAVVAADLLDADRVGNHARVSLVGEAHVERAAGHDDRREALPTGAAVREVVGREALVLLMNGPQRGAVEHFKDGVRCVSGTGHDPRGRDLVGAHGQAGERPRGRVGPRAGPVLMVAAAEAAARRGRPGAYECGGRVVNEDRRRSQGCAAETEHVVWTVHVHELRVLTDAVLVREAGVLPGVQRRAVHALPGADLAAAADEQVVQVAGEADLAVVGDEDVEGSGGLRLEDVRVQLDVDRAVRHAHGVARGLVNRVVVDAAVGGAAAAGDLHADPITRVVVDDVVLDQAAPAGAGGDIPGLDAHGVGVNHVAADDGEAPGTDAVIDVVVDAVEGGRAAAGDADAVEVVVDHVVAGLAAVDVDADVVVAEVAEDRVADDQHVIGRVDPDRAVVVNDVAQRQGQIGIADHGLNGRP